MILGDESRQLLLLINMNVNVSPGIYVNTAPVNQAAGVNHGTMSAIQNNYGTSAAGIERLITVLRDQAQTFPEEHKDDTLDTLDVLQGEVAKSEPDKARIGRWVKRLGAIATLTAATTAAATGFSADLAQLADYLEVPAPDIIQVEPE